MKKHPIMTAVLVIALLMLAYIARQDLGLDPTLTASAAAPAPSWSPAPSTSPAPSWLPAPSASPFPSSAPTPTTAPQPSTQPTSAGDPEEQLLEGLRKREPVVTVQDADGDTIKPIFRRIIREHPEFFWLTGSADLLTTTSATGKYVEVTPEMIGTPEEIERKAAELEAVVEALLGELPSWASEYEKMLYVHDYIVEIATYDTATLETRLRYGEDAPIDNEDAYNAYGCLVKNISVCAGYAKAFQLIMGRLGIACGYVTGSDLEGGSHAWNWVTMDGDSFYVDTTWDDPTIVGSDGICSHANCGITTDELLRTHIIESGQTLPVCDTEEYDYFRYAGLFLESDNPDITVSIILNNSDKHDIEIKYASPALRNEIVQKLLKEGGLFEYAGSERCRGLRYSELDDGRVLRIFY